MGTYGALAHTMWMGGYDLGADLTQMGLTVTFEPLKDTRFGMTAQSRRGGLQDVQASANGFHQAGDDLVDAELWAQFSETMQPVTQTPTGTVGDVAYFYQARKFTQSLFGNVGELAPFTIGAQGVRGPGTLSAGAIRGRLLVPKGDVSGTGGAGSVVQLGAVASNQYVYAAVHVFSAGTTLTFTISSDDNAGFTSGTTLATLGPLTTTGGTWVTRVAGPITDDYWLVNVTAITGTFNIAVAVGIQ
jgi:hypothetical protein